MVYLKKDDYPSMAEQAEAMGHFLARQAEIGEESSAAQREMDKLFVEGVFGAMFSRRALPIWAVLGASVLSLSKTFDVHAAGVGDVGHHLVGADAGLSVGPTVDASGSHVAMVNPDLAFPGMQISVGEGGGLELGVDGPVGAVNGEQVDLRAADNFGYTKPVIGARLVTELGLRESSTASERAVMEAMKVSLMADGVDVENSRFLKLELYTRNGASVLREAMGGVQAGIAAEPGQDATRREIMLAFSPDGKVSGLMVLEHGELVAVPVEAMSELVDINGELISAAQVIELTATFATDAAGNVIKSEALFGVPGDPRALLRMYLNADGTVALIVVINNSATGDGVDVSCENDDQSLIAYRVTPAAPDDDSSDDTELPAPMAAEVVAQWQAALGTGYEIRGNQIVDVSDPENAVVIPGVTLNAGGTGVWQYEYDGNGDVAVPLGPETIKHVDDWGKPLPAGHINFFERGFIWNGEELVRKEYKGERLQNWLEAQAFLANEANVDLTQREYDPGLSRPFTSNGGQGSGRPIFRFNQIRESRSPIYWADNIIPIPDGKGGFVEQPTTVFKVQELWNTPITLVYYFGSDGLSHVMLVDGVGFARKDVTAGDPAIWNPTKWSSYYLTHDEKW